MDPNLANFGECYSILEKNVYSADVGNKFICVNWIKFVIFVYTLYILIGSECPISY